MKKYLVTLSTEERQQLQALVKTGRVAARTWLHAQILLHADTATEEWTDERISTALDVHPTTVAHVRQRFVEEGLEVALQRRRGRTSPRRKKASRRPTSSPWLVANRPMGRPAGVYGYWLSGW